MNDLEQRLNELVSSFINTISKLARQTALDTLSQALDGVGGTVRAKLGSGSAKAPASLGAAAKAAPRGRRSKGAKRAPEEIAQMREQVLAHVKEKPGERIEQINAQLGTRTADLSLPIKKLIAEGAIRTEGDRRATKYFPGEGTPRPGGRRGGKRKG